jgi:site-specific DNA recombinase
MFAIYARLSKDDDDSNSIENQIKEGYQYAHLNNITDDKIFVYDEGDGVKGSDPIEKRPELQKLMKDIHAGKIKMLFVRKQSRISRKLRMFNDILEQMIDCDLKLYMADKGGLLDLKSPMTKLMLQIMAAFDEYAPNQQSSETIKTLSIRANEGKVVGIVPYGYKINKSGYAEKITKQADTVNQIFDWYINENIGFKAIANRLNTAGVPTKYEVMVQEGKENLTSHRKHRNGVIWQSSTISGLLSCEWYIGKRVYQNKTRYDVPEIVKKTKWTKAQQVRESRKHRRFESTPKYNYLLKGLIKCEKCGRNWYGRFRENKNDNFYLCSGKDNKVTNCKCPSINIYKLESFIIKFLFKSKDLKKMMESIDKDDKVITQLELEIATTKSKLDEATKSANRYLKNMGKSDDEGILDQYNKARTTAKNLQQKLDNLEVKHDDLTQSEALKNYNRQIQLIEGKSDFKTLKMAVDNIIESINIETMINPKTNKDLFILKINFIGLYESSTFWVERPYKDWFHYIDTIDATPEQSEKMLEEGIKQYEQDAQEFDLIGDRSEFLLDYTKVDNYQLQNIILTNKDLVKFNVKSKDK